VLDGRYAWLEEDIVDPAGELADRPQVAGHTEANGSGPAAANGNGAASEREAAAAG
jgi:hypothetical protein